MGVAVPWIRRCFRRSLAISATAFRMACDDPVLPLEANPPPSDGDACLVHEAVEEWVGKVGEAVGGEGGVSGEARAEAEKLRRQPPKIGGPPQKEGAQ